jgi:hypothetical protein
MRKAYLETNAICRAQEANISGTDLRQLLEQKGLTPVVGLHAIYELARTFLNDKNTDTAMQLFTIINELSPEFSNQLGVLMYQEVNKCLNDDDIVPLLIGEEKESAMNEVHKLSIGNFDDKAREFIEERNNNFQIDHVKISEHNLELFKKNPPSKRLRTFEDVFTYYENDFPSLIVKIFNDELSEKKALAVIEKIDTYPTIRSNLRAQIYLMFVELVNGVVPNKDKVDDHRHIIEAAYCDAFITNDSQLTNNANKINPNLEIIGWKSLI